MSTHGKYNFTDVIEVREKEGRNIFIEMFCAWQMGDDIPPEAECHEDIDLVTSHVSCVTVNKRKCHESHNVMMSCHTNDCLRVTNGPCREWDVDCEQPGLSDTSFCLSSSSSCFMSQVTMHCGKQWPSRQTFYSRTWQYFRDLWFSINRVFLFFDMHLTNLNSQ